MRSLGLHFILYLILIFTICACNTSANLTPMRTEATQGPALLTEDFSQIVGEKGDIHDPYNYYLKEQSELEATELENNTLSEEQDNNEEVKLAQNSFIQNDYASKQEFYKTYTQTFYLVVSLYDLVFLINLPNQLNYYLF